MGPRGCRTLSSIESLGDGLVAPSVRTTSAGFIIVLASAAHTPLFSSSSVKDLDFTPLIDGHGFPILPTTEGTLVMLSSEPFTLKADRFVDSTSDLHDSSLPSGEDGDSIRSLLRHARIRCADMSLLGERSRTLEGLVNAYAFRPRSGRFA